jgi:MYXO-CTERM domain-containing protein
MTISRQLATATLVAVSLPMAGAQAAEYFVDPAGSDGNNGTSATSAWATLAALAKVKAGDTVNFKAGGKWTTTGGITVNGATYQAYGAGNRPQIDGKNITFATVKLGSNAVLDGFKITADTVFGVYIQGDNSLVQNCEIDGSGTAMQMALGVMGNHNLVTQNYAHDLTQNTGDTGNVNSSGGAECFVHFFGDDNEYSYNTAIKCACKNKTLGGDEGGCVEIINPNGGKTIKNIRFHHNYCELDVGLFEACTGSGTGKENPADNPGTIQDILVAYNLCVDSKWLFLLQILNTHMKNVVFEHNSIIHTARNQTFWDQGAMSHQDMLGMFFYSDAGTGSSVSSVVLPTDIIVRNNLFLEPHNKTGVWIGSGFGHTNNVYAPSTIALKDQAGGTFKLDSTEILVDTEAGLKLTADYRLGVGSPAIDQGTTNAFTTYVDDIDRHKLPCGAAPDIGASEYCDGAPSIPQGIGGTIGGGGGVGGSSGTAAATGGVSGGGGSPGAGGASGTGGATARGGATGSTTTSGAGGGGGGNGGATGKGGASGQGGDSDAGTTVGPGGGDATARGGAAATGGAPGAGGAPGTGGATTTALASGGSPGGGGAPGSGGSSTSVSFGNGGSNGPTVAPTTTSTAGNGCACALGGGQPRPLSPGGFLLLAGLLLGIVRRRRR